MVIKEATAATEKRQRRETGSGRVYILVLTLQRRQFSLESVAFFMFYENQGRSSKLLFFRMEFVPEWEVKGLIKHCDA